MFNGQWIDGLKLRRYGSERYSFERNITATVIEATRMNKIVEGKHVEEEKRE